MQKISFVDNNLLLGDCHVKRDYGQLRQQIIGGSHGVTEQLTNNGEVFGYHVTKNEKFDNFYHIDSGWFYITGTWDDRGICGQDLYQP